MLYTNIDFADDRRVHGEDVVPLVKGPVRLVKGPVPPSAPNPPIGDASGHYPSWCIKLEVLLVLMLFL